MNKKELRKQLTNWPINYEKGLEIRSRLEQQAEENYTSKHSAIEMLEFISKNIDGFTTNKLHPQSPQPYVYSLFTEKTQTIHADSFLELMDKAIDNYEPKEKKGKA